jgi:hypothetical protein
MRQITPATGWTLALGLGLGLALAAGSARAEESGTADGVRIEVTVLLASDQPGESDPRCERFDKLLRGQVAYESLSILDTHEREVPLDEVWTVELPTQKHLQIRALAADPQQGTLLSLDVEESVQGDFRVRRGQPLVVGGPRFGEGRLVVVFETETP